MTVTNWAKKIAMMFFSSIFILPYTEINKIREVLTCIHSSGTVFVPSIITLMLITGIVMSPLWIASFRVPRSRSDKGYAKRCFVAILLFCLLVLIQAMFSSSPVKMLFQLMWVVVPFYFAFFSMSIINRLGLDVAKIHCNGLVVFSLYLVYNIFVNITKYGFSFGTSNPVGRSRLVSSGGGPVILGYTIAIMFALLLFYQPKISKSRFMFSFLVMVIASFFTGSRGSMWPVVFLITLFLMDRRLIIRVGLVMIPIAMFFVNPIEFLRENLPRFFDLLEVGRLATAHNVVSIFSLQFVLEIFFGKGLGAFFPYQEWLLFRKWSNTYVPNVFIYSGSSLLVQPHNSYIYLLLETGIIGVALFFFPVLQSIRYSLIWFRGKQGATDKYRVLATVLVGALNLFDSIFIVAPGSAALWWFVLLSLNCHCDKVGD